MSLHLTLYTKMDCELCEPFKQVVQSITNLKLLHNQLELTLIDIQTDTVAHERYHDKVPALEVNGRLAFKYHITERELLAYLKRF
jgi:hypothetical protein